MSEIELRQAIEMNREFYIGYYELGRLFQLQEEYDEAVSSYVKSVEKSGGQFLPLSPRLTVSFQREITVPQWKLLTT